MQGIPLSVLLQEYGDLVKKTIIPAQNLPNVTFDYSVNNDLTFEETKILFETLLSQRAIAVIPLGEKFVQVIPSAEVVKTPPKFTKLTHDELPEGEVYIIKTVQLQHALPSELTEVLSSYAKSPNAVQAIDSTKTLVLRDYSSNVKRMLELIDLVDVEEKIEQEYEIVRIKYALSGDIEAVLNTMTSTTSPTGRTGASTTGRTGGTTGRTGGTTGTTGRTTTRRWAAGTTGGAGSTGSLQQRLSQVRQGASVTGSGLPILGDTRIVSYERNNEVVLFGKKKQIALAKTIITQLDRVQKQVLIEAMIIDVALGENKSFGASIRQSKQGFGGNNPNGGLGGALASALGPAAFTPTTVQDAASGFSYYGFLGNNWEVAVNALETDTRVDMLSTPRIQTSHAEQAQLFIGEERPVISGTFSDISGGQTANIQMKQIGITLEILPFINDEGLVVMDIYQRIQDIVGSQSIDGNDIPITTDRSANSKVAVRDGEMIMLGGFVKTKKTATKNGVPLLRHIPILGKLFENSADVDERFELIVLLRPTVLDTPAAAHAKALELSNGLPGIDGAKRNEKFIEDKWRFLRDKEIKMLDKKSEKFRPILPDANQGDPKLKLPLIPQLPPKKD
jgi:general secretion pathway protein D